MERETEGDQQPWRSTRSSAPTPGGLRRWLADGHLAAAATRELTVHLADLTTMYRAHIAAEDGDLFPLVRRVLSPAAIAELGSEMASRRGVRIGSADGSVMQEEPRSAP